MTTKNDNKATVLRTVGKDGKVTWTILSITGGGIRGIIPATFLDAVEKRTGRSVAKLFKIVAGTSTGGILTAGLTLPNCCGEPAYTASQMVDLYFKEGPTIFSKNLIRQVWHQFVVGGAKYSAKGIESVLAKYFGNALYKNQLCRTIIAAYETSLRSAWFFKNWDPDDGERKVAYVCRATSAAQTYFDPVQNGETGAFIDGGNPANDPALCALAEAILLSKPGDDFLVVSIGTGKYERPYTYKQLTGFRLWDWATATLDIIMDSQPQVVNYQLEKLMQLQMPQLYHERAGHTVRRFYTFDAELDPSTDAMDNASLSNMQALKKLGAGIVEKQAADFDAMCERLVQILDEEEEVIAEKDDAAEARRNQ